MLAVYVRQVLAATQEDDDDTGDDEEAGPPAPARDAPVTPEVEARVQELLRRPYRMSIRGEPEEGYLAEAPELPGCVTAGETPEEAMTLLRDAMASWLLVAVERGDRVPEPAPEPSRASSGKFLLRLPTSRHQQLAERAAAEGVSLNQLALTCLALGFGRGPSASA